MQLTSKDRSLILLITAVIIAIWSAFSISLNIFRSINSQDSKFVQIITNQENEWLNLSRPLDRNDLKNRISLLYFWSEGVDCSSTIDDIKKLEEEFGSRLLVISIYLPLPQENKDNSSLRKSILKCDINYPAINDGDGKVHNHYKVKSSPTIIITDIRGKIFKRYDGDYQFDKLHKDINRIITRYRFEINRDQLPLLLEKNNEITNVLRFPSKILYISNFQSQSGVIPVIAISNSGNNEILISSLNGEIIEKIGSSVVGFEDGDFSKASFDNPTGLLFLDNMLYVADSNNHAIRLVNLKEKTVKTLMGSGVSGEAMSETIDSKSANLSSPNDLELFNDGILINNYGSNQILHYNLKTHKIAIFAGDGRELVYDGKYPHNSLARIKDLAIFNKKVYFIDGTTSSLRSLDSYGSIKTIIANVNDTKTSIATNNPMAVYVDDTGIYIVDSVRSVVKRYDFSTKQLSTIAGSKRGFALSPKLQMDQPSSIISFLGNFYISDSNNNRLIKLNRNDFSASIFDVIPKLELRKEALLQYLPNNQDQKSITLSSDENIRLIINLPKGWKINPKGPSFINILRPVSDEEAELMFNFDWQKISDKDITMPSLKDGEYLLQGVIYYCEDKRDSLCYVKSYEQKIEVAKEYKNTKIELNLQNKINNKNDNLSS